MIQRPKLPQGYICSSSFSAYFSPNMLCFLDKLIHAHAQLTPSPLIHLTQVGDSKQRGYHVNFVVTVSRGSLRTGDTNRSFPEESPWPGSLPSVRTVLPNPVSPERELLPLYRWMDIGLNEASSIKCHQAQTGFSFGCHSAQLSGLKTEYNQWKQPVHWKRGVSSEDTGKSPVWPD